MRTLHFISPPQPRERSNCAVSQRVTEAASHHHRRGEARTFSRCSGYAVPLATDLNPRPDSSHRHLSTITLIRRPTAVHFLFPPSLGPPVRRVASRNTTRATFKIANRKTPPHSIRFYRRRPLAVASGVGKVSALELRSLCPELRRYSPLLSSSSRIHPVGLRPARTRSISYSSIPRFVARVFRVPIAGVTVGAGGLVCADYKFGGTLSPTLSCSIAQQLPSVRQDLATSLDQYLQRPHRRRARYRERYPC